MANPQKEDGHVDIANEIVEALAKIHLSSYESQVLWVIFRKTYGWHKKEDWITNTQISDMTGIAETHVSRTIKILIQKNLIIKNGKKLSFQKNYDQWEKLPKGVTSHHKKKLPKGVIKLPKGVKEITKGGIKKLPKGVDTKEKKETITKETIQKEKTLRFEIIEYLNKITEKKFKPNTSATIKCINARLKEGFNLNDFKYVIDVKWNEWKGKITKEGKNMEDWLRPITLFGTKFESYLNQGKPDPYEKYYRKE
jgi:phage replication O-like protein O